MIFVQIVPAHLINAHRENRLHVRVDALWKEFGQHQFIDEKSRGMAEVKNERVSQGNRLLEITRIIGEAFEKAHVGIKGVGEVGSNFGAFVLHRPNTQIRRSKQADSGFEGSAGGLHFRYWHCHFWTRPLLCLLTAIRLLCGGWFNFPPKTVQTIPLLKLLQAGFFCQSYRPGRAQGKKNGTR